jgi:hypothetical protein
MRRRGVLLLLAAFLTGVAIAQSPGEQFRRGVQADLKQQLEAGLYARRPAEFAFIARVVQLVDQGQLPESLVKSTFAWARRKRPYPLVYFERALRLRARKIGIVVQGIEAPRVFQ